MAALARLLDAESRQRNLDGGGQISTMLAEPSGLRRLTEDLIAATPPAHRLLIVVDQAEELVSPGGGAPQQHFAVLLKEATRGSVRVVAALRSEYLDPFTRYTSEIGLYVHPFVLNMLARQLLRDIITGPARIAGIKADEELVARMVSDTGSGEALPLLAFVLERLAVGLRRGDELSRQLYELLGGVHGALAGQADAALAAACAAGGRAESEVLASLLRLIIIDDAGRKTCRRIEYEHLSKQVRIELAEFVDRRLLTIDVEDGRPVISFTHEKVLSTWAPLKRVAANAVDVLRLRRTLEDAAVAWESAGHPKDHLWGARRINAAKRVVTDITPRAANFLREGRRQARRRKLFAVGALFFLCIGGLAAAVKWSGMITQRDAAETARRDAISDGLVASSAALRHTDPRSALRYGLAANLVTPGPHTQANLIDLLANSPIMAVIEEHKGPVNATAFSPDGQVLATGSEDGAVLLWDINNPERPSRLGGALRYHIGPVTSLAFSPDGRTLATGGTDRRIVLWDVADRRSSHRRSEAAEDHRGPVTSLAFSPDGTTLATGSTDHTVNLWDVSDPSLLGRPSASLDAHTNFVVSVAFSPDGATLATGSTDHTVVLWDVSVRHAPQRLGAPLRHAEAVSSVAFSPDGAMLATSSVDNTVTLWGVTAPGAAHHIGSLIGYSEWVNSLAFSPNGSKLATAGADGMVMLWDISDPRAPVRLNTPLGHPGEVISVAFAPDGSSLASGGSDGTVILWRLDGLQVSRRPVESLSHTGPVRSLAFSPGGTILATGSGDDGATLWNLADRNMAHYVSFRKDQLVSAYSVTFSSDGSTLVTAGSGGAVILWNVADRQAAGRLAISDSDCIRATSMALVPHGTTLAIGCEYTVTLWDVAEAAKPYQIGDPLRAHRGPVTSVAFAPDGNILATAGDDGTVIVWDVTDREEPRRLGDPLRAHRGPVTSVAFAPDGNILATAGDDGMTLLWKVEDVVALQEDPVGVACRRVHRGFTPAEWDRNIPGFPYRATC
jgi:WD40 repeat protein